MALQTWVKTLHGKPGGKPSRIDLKAPWRDKCSQVTPLKFRLANSCPWKITPAGVWKSPARGERGRKEAGVRSGRDRPRQPWRSSTTKTNAFGRRCGRGRLACRVASMQASEVACSKAIRYQHARWPCPYYWHQRADYILLRLEKEGWGQRGVRVILKSTHQSDRGLIQKTCRAPLYPLQDIKGLSSSAVARATQAPSRRPSLHSIVTCNARRQALVHLCLIHHLPVLPTPDQPSLAAPLPHPLPGLQVLTALLTAAVSTSQDSSRPIRTMENCVSQWESSQLPVCPVPSTCTVISKWNWIYPCPLTKK